MLPDYAYFRTNSIKLRVRNDFQAKHVIDAMKAGVKELIDALNWLRCGQSMEFD